MPEWHCSSIAPTVHTYRVVSLVCIIILVSTGICLLSLTQLNLGVNSENHFQLWLLLLQLSPIPRRLKNVVPVMNAVRYLPRTLDFQLLTTASRF